MRIVKTVFGVLVVIVAAAVAALIYGMPAGFLLDPIQNRFEANTGYQLRVAGNSRVGIWPSPGLTLRDISIASKADPEAHTRVTADSVRVRLPFASLFSTSPEITDVTVLRPTVRVPVTRERTAQNSRSIGSSERKVAAERPFTLDRLLVRDGTLLMVSRGDRVEGRLDKIEGEGSLAAGETVTLKLSALAGKEPIRLDLKGRARDGRFDVAPISLDFVFEAPGVLTSPVPGSAEIRISGSTVSINSLTGTLERNRFNAWASIDLANKPLVKLDIDFPRIEVEGTRPAAGATRDDAAADIDRPWSTQPLDLDALNFFDAEVKISAADLTLDTFRFSPVAVSATLAKGVLRATFDQVGVYGGELRGGYAADVSTGLAHHALRVDLNGMQAYPLLADVAGFTALDGRMQARIDVHAQGASQREIMASLDGTLDLVVTDGQIRNVNIAQMIRNLTASSLNGWQEDRAQKTDMSQLGVLFRIQKGQAVTDNFRLVGPLVRVSGAGTVDLAGKTLNFRLDPRLVMTLEGQGTKAADPVGFGVPVMMQGPWGQPRVNLDMAGILDNPDAAYAKLRALGDGLFGTDAGKGIMKGLGGLIDNLARDNRSPPAPDGRLPPPQSSQSEPQGQSGTPQQKTKPQDTETQIRDILRDLFGR